MADIIDMRAAQLYRWYRNSLSSYQEELKDGSFHQHDILSKDKRRGKEEIQPVPILKVENMGADMAVDEKQIADEMFTILLNRKTGKIALMAQSMKVKELVILSEKLGDKRFDVRTVTCDLSPTYDWYIRQTFMNAAQIADKFHIVTHLEEALQDHRIRLKHEYLSNWRADCESQKKKLPHTKLSNGETIPELLARSRYLLFKLPQDWSASQKERAAVLFHQYPNLKTDHELKTWLRNWYDKTNIGKPLQSIKEQLQLWCNAVDDAASDELKNFKHTLLNNQGKVIHYFTEGKTNAQAENLNGRIQSFIRSNFGIRDKDFFLWRCKQYFS